jgi:hypothetical protein
MAIVTEQLSQIRQRMASTAVATFVTAMAVGQKQVR